MSFWDDLGSGFQKIGEYANPLRLGQKVDQGLNTGLNDMGLHPLAQVTTAPAGAIMKGGNQVLGGVMREGGYLAHQVPGVGNALGNVADMGTNVSGYQSMGNMKQDNANAYNQNVMQPISQAMGSGSPAQVGTPIAMPAGGNARAQMPQANQGGVPQMQLPSPSQSPGVPVPTASQQPMQAVGQWNPLQYGMNAQGINQLQSGIQAPYIPPMG